MMHALKHPSFFRPTSRPSSPAPAPPSRPDSGIGFERTSRPLHKLSLSNFRKSSPAPIASPANSPATLVQDGSYLEMLSLKLSEAASKALAQPTGPAPPHEVVAGKRPIPAGRGRALGALIASELRASHDNPHLYRASIRSLHRPLSVLVSNLSTQLVPLLASPALLNFSGTVAQSPNPTQLHALAIATFAGELFECFNDAGLGLDNDPHGLKSVREGLVSVINRVINPLIGAAKSDLGTIVDGLESSYQTSHNKAHATKTQHPSLAALQGSLSAYTRTLERCISLPGSQTTIATFLISLIWRGLVALSNRPYQPPSPPASPALLAQNIKKRRGSSTTPPMTPPSSRFTMKLPPSRPPSPPSFSASASVTTDARALYETLTHLPRPVAGKEANLAKEAVDEAFAALKAFGPFAEAVYAMRVSSVSATIGAEELVTLAQEIPTLIALPVILNAYGSPSSASLPQLLNLDAAEYKKVCLSGFGRAEECGPVVGQYVLDVLLDTDPSGLVVKWLELELAAEPAAETVANGNPLA